MKTAAITSLLLIHAMLALAQEGTTAATKDGKTVQLNPDGTYRVISGQDPNAAQDLQKMQGTWFATDDQYHGVPTRVEEVRSMRKTLTVKDTGFYMQRVLRTGQFGNLFNGTISLNAATNPKRFAWSGIGSDGKFAGMVGLYEVTDDSLRIVYTLFSDPDEHPPYPTRFSSAGEGGGTVVLTLRRKPIE